MSFHRFHKTWFDHLQTLVRQLTLAPKPPTTEEQNQNLLQLVHKTMTHLSDYYRVKSLAADHDILAVFTAPWSTSLERSLHWVAGWRPTTLFHLVYTESSILFESHIFDILRGQRTGDLGDLSPSQFQRVSELQCETVHEENSISEELSEWQDSASDLIGLCSSIDGKMEQLVRILAKADDLRLRTLRRVVELLTPQQAVEFLGAATELLFSVHGWGLNQDDQRGNV